MTGRRRHRERKPAMPEAHPLDWQMPDGEPLWAFLERLADEAARQGPRFAEFRTAAAQKTCQGMVPILAAFLARHPHYAPRRLPPIFVDCLETLGHWRIVLAWQVPLSGPEILAFLVTGKQDIAATGAEIRGKGRVAYGKLWQGQPVLIAHTAQVTRYEIGMAKHAVFLDGLWGEGQHRTHHRPQLQTPTGRSSPAQLIE
jgi:hypothetical protein